LFVFLIQKEKKNHNISICFFEEEETNSLFFSLVKDIVFGESYKWIAFCCYFGSIWSQEGLFLFCL